MLQKMVQEGQDLRDKGVVLPVTGSGLKDVGSAIKAGSEPISIKPELERALYKLER